MKLVVFGLTISSSWGNGHATLWRGLCRALARRGHRLVFFERDQPYYASARDLDELPGLTLVLYDSFAEARRRAEQELEHAEAGIVTSYCPDAKVASELLFDSHAETKCYYDMDTPVTLASVERGESVSYVPDNGLSDFDLVLSYTGGQALSQLSSRLHAKRVVPLYGSVDPELHRRTAAKPAFRGSLSYLGTYAQDRQAGLDELLLAPADILQRERFVIAGAQYPAAFPWRHNVSFVRHLPPADHSAFYVSSLATLNVTRAAMKKFGYCPSPRLFEAAACGVPLISDGWEGLDCFLEPGSEVVLAHDRTDVVAALSGSASELQRIGARARDRVLGEHTAAQRVLELERALFGGGAAAEREPGVG